MPVCMCVSGKVDRHEAPILLGNSIREETGSKLSMIRSETNELKESDTN